MSHTLHRFGPEESFENDFCVVSRPAMGFNERGAAPKLRKIIEILYEAGVANSGSLTSRENIFTEGFDKQKMLDRIEDNSPLNAVFSSRENLVKALERLKEEDLGISVVVTGLRDKVEDICEEVGLTPHSLDISLGIFGKTELLSDEETMCVSSMCGHAMISAGLVAQIRKSVEDGVLSPEEGAKRLAKPCYCGVFNIQRTEDFLSAWSGRKEEASKQQSGKVAKLQSSKKNRRLYDDEAEMRKCR